MADLNSSLDEILTELGDDYDGDITPRRIVRSTANKIWLQLRAFARGLYGLYQVVAALRWRFDPLYCTEDELASTMRITGVTRIPGKTSLLTVTVWNNTDTPQELIGGTNGTPDGGSTRYVYTSANGNTFAIDLFETIIIQPNNFTTLDFHSVIGDSFLIGAFPVSLNSNIAVTRSDGIAVTPDLTFDCEDNENQLGYPEETMFEVRQRILTDNQRQDLLHILEERLKQLPNIHECTILYNNSLIPQPMPYRDDNNNPILLPPQAVFVILTGSPTKEFAETFLTLCPFITVDNSREGSTIILAEAVDKWVVNFPSPIYINGLFPVFYVKHLIANFSVIVKYGYNALTIDTEVIEQNYTELLRPFKASTRWQQIVKIEDYFNALSAWTNANVRLLSISFVATVDGNNYFNPAFEINDDVKYIIFQKTMLARLANVGFQAVSLWQQQ